MKKDMVFQKTMQAGENSLKTGISCHAYRHAFSEFPSHRHLYMEFFFVKSNEVLLTLENDQCVCNAGDLMIVPIMASHSVNYTNTQCSEHLILQADVSYLLQGRDDLTNKSIILGKNRDRQFIFRPENSSKMKEVLMYVFDRCMAFENPNEPTIAEAWGLKAFCFSLLNSLMEEGMLEITDREKGMVDVSSLLKIQPILKLLSNNYNKRLTLEEAADLVHMSYHHFSRTFKQLFGYNFVEYQNLLRVRRAQEYIASTNKSMSEISSSLNFETQSHFNRLFKQYCEMTPLEYRKKYSHT